MMAETSAHLSSPGFIHPGQDFALGILQNLCMDGSVSSLSSLGEAFLYYAVQMTSLLPIPLHHLLHIELWFSMLVSPGELVKTVCDSVDLG